LVNVASPRIDVSVEIETGASQKVDDHPTTGAMMAKDRQQLIGREVVGATRNLSHWNMQSAFQASNIQLSSLTDVENRMLFPCA
jgi:hypothetical protein